jgi:Ni/Co efflux regulator RcnB
MFMNRTVKAFALPVMALALMGSPSFSQDHPDQDHRDNGAYKQHTEWKVGAKVAQDDWNRGDKVDYKEKHLRRPPENHEWRKIDGHYVMADQDGKIASVRTAPRNNHQKSPDQHPQ